LIKDINIYAILQVIFLVANIFDKTKKEHGAGIYSPGRSFIIRI